MSELRSLAETMGALQVILTAPPWPARESLPPAAHPLFDAIVRDAKPYARHLARQEYAAAADVLKAWAAPVHAFLDNVRVADHDPCQRLLAVFTHYMQQLGDWSKLEKRA